MCRVCTRCPALVDSDGGYRHQLADAQCARSVARDAQNENEPKLGAAEIIGHGKRGGRRDRERGIENTRMEMKTPETDTGKLACQKAAGRGQVI